MCARDPGVVALARAAYTRETVLKLRRLKIDRFRNVAPGTELHFDDGVNVVLGKNGTGKTSLLALISAVCRWDFKDYQQESLSFQVVFTGGKADFSASFSFLLSDGRSQWEYGIAHGTTVVRGTDVQTVFQSPRESLTGAAVSPFEPALLVRLENTFRPLNWRGLAHFAAFRLDEANETFVALTSGGADGAKAVIGSVVPPVDTWVFPDLPNVRFERPGLEFMPFSLVEIAGRSLGSDAEDPRVSLPETWAKLLGFDGLQWRPVVLESTPPTAAEVFPPRRVRLGRFSFRATRRDGSWVSHERLSYGQRRMLAVLWYLETNGRLLIADELVNGLHHEWIEAVVGMLSDRQAFLTSQNPLLFDFLKVQSAEQVERMFVMCESSEDERGSVTLRWRNMTADEARSFYEELAVGADFVSEVLLRRGLW